MKLLLLSLSCFFVSFACAATELPLQTAMDAARNHDAKEMTAWLDAGGNPNQATPEGWSPLLIAAARGYADVVEVLLSHPTHPANPKIPFAPSGALPIHLAGQSGNVPTVKLLLDANPSDLDAIWLLNGHTLLLQAAFYGHVDLAKFALEKGANPNATTLRGLTAMDFAHQFDNQPLIEMLSVKPVNPDAKKAYFEKLLAQIRETVPKDQIPAQTLADEAGAAIVSSLAEVSVKPEEIEKLDAKLDTIIQNVDVHRLSGDLRQPLLVISVTGNNLGPNPQAAADLRLRIVKKLLARGASPLQKENHPMGADSIIRASVFGHLDILKAMGAHLTSEELAGGLNAIPVVNGLTALHDGVLRSGTVDESRFPRYLDQIRWEVANGARADIPDFSGRTQLEYAEKIADPTRRELILDALKNPRAVPQWNHPAIAVPNLEEAMRWYEDVFGFMPLITPKVHSPATPEPWKIALSIFGEGIQQVRLVRMRAPNAPLQQALEIFEVTPPPAESPKKRTSGYIHACMIVGDVGMTASRIEARGGKILSQATLGTTEISFCQDPYGNIIELASAPW